MQSALLGVAVVSVVISCDKTDAPVHFVVPNGYRGMFVVYPGQKDGTEISLKEGQYTYIVPDDGIIRVRGEGPFATRQEMSASYSDGTPLPLYASEDADPETDTGIWAAGTISSGGIWFVVGVRREQEGWAGIRGPVPGRLRIRHRETKAVLMEPDAGLLWGSDLSSQDLRGADLYQAELTQADLSNSDLRGADIRNARLSARLRSANLAGADMIGTTLEGADASDAVFDGADMARTSLKDAVLVRASMIGVRLVGSQIERTDLRGADLRNADLSHAWFIGADLRGADLTGVRMTEARYDERTKWPEGFDPTVYGAVLDTRLTGFSGPSASRDD